MIIKKTFRFEAAHRLPDEDCYGKCSCLHGHSYKLEVEVAGGISNKGWVMNFDDLKKIVDPIVQRLDHSFLNDLFPLSTAEVVVRCIAACIESRLPKDILFVAATLWETSTCCAIATMKDVRHQVFINPLLDEGSKNAQRGS